MRMEGYGRSAQPPEIAQCLHGGYGWLQVKCRRCETEASIPLERIRRPPDTPIFAQMPIVPDAAVLAAGTPALTENRGIALPGAPP
jgi:hypothetical protein